MWADDLSDIGYDEALVAMREHFRTSAEYLMPLHIVRGVKAMRAKGTMSPDVPSDCGNHRWLADGTCLFCTTQAHALTNGGDE